MSTVLLAFRRWLTGRWPPVGAEGCDETAASAEAIALRCLALVLLVACVVATTLIEPRPALHGSGLAVLVGLIVLALSAAAAQPIRRDGRRGPLLLSLLGVTAGAITLALAQPKGVWSVGVYYVAVIAALRLDRRTGGLVLFASLAPFVIGAAVQGKLFGALVLPLGVLPWYLVMRLLRSVQLQREELQESRVAEAAAAAAAERGRLAREMHDVLAHSLSALALQLESTRLLARDRHVDEQLAQAIEKAHHLAATGLQEARRAIATARGEELPGPERIGALANAFGEQSGLPVRVAVHGEPRELAPEARLAVYRTAQEALTNVRRHATAERVEVNLDYGPQSTVLVVEDHATLGAPAPAPLELTGSGYGLTGMRERAELLGGELLAGPTTAGFRVELRLPA
jgi:signal transduction histidine kinase